MSEPHTKLGCKGTNYFWNAKTFAPKFSRETKKKGSRFFLKAHLQFVFSLLAICLFITGKKFFDG